MSALVRRTWTHACATERTASTALLNSKSGQRLIMSPVADSHSAYSCTTIRYVLDARRDVTVPVGVVLWSADAEYLQFRLPKPGERIEGFHSATANPYLQAAQAQIES